MKYIISIILIFNISVVNANEIFNLLKIPNLEIYNTNSLNGLKYLYAESNFEIGLKKNMNSLDRRSFRNCSHFQKKNYPNL